MYLSGSLLGHEAERLAPGVLQEINQISVAPKWDHLETTAAHGNLVYFLLIIDGIEKPSFD